MIQDMMAREGMVMAMEDMEKERAYAGGRGRTYVRGRDMVYTRGR